MNWDNISLDSSSGNLTVTLGSNLNLTGTISFLGSASSFFYAFTGGSFTVNAGTLSTGTTTSQAGLVLNGATINTNSFIAPSITGCNISGTSKIVLTGTGTVNIADTHTAFINNSIDINSTSTTFIGNFRYRAGTVRHIAGTVTTTNSTLRIFGTCGLNTVGMNWNNISLDSGSGSLTVTLGSNLNLTGTISFLGSSSSFPYIFTGSSFTVNAGTLSTGITTSQAGIVLNGATINTNSFIAPSVTSCNISGTSKIVLTGTGTVNIAATHTAFISNSIDINSTSTTFVGNFRYQTGTLRYIAGTVDTSASTLVLTAASTLNTAGLEWNNITIGAALTLTLTSAFTCSGTFTIVAALTVVGTGFWTRVGNLTITGSNLTLTLLNNLTVTGTFRNSSTFTINGNSLFVSSLKAGGYVFGTTTIVFNGTGTWSGAWDVANNVTINTAGTLTIGIGSSETVVPSTSEVNYAAYKTGTLTYTAGTVTLGNPSTGYLFITGSCTLNTSGMTWGSLYISTATTTLSSNLNVTNIRFSGTNSFVGANRFTQASTLTLTGTTTLTLLNNVTVLNNFICNNSGGVQTINGFQLICNGGITTTGTGNTAGTTTILLNGTGTWSAPLITDTNAIRNNTVINTAGTITFSGYPQFNTGTLTYTAGTVVTTGAQLSCWANTTLNTAGISWDIVSFVGTITLASNLTVTGRAKIGGTTTFVNTNRFTQVPILEIVNSATLTLINNLTVTNTFISSNNGSAQAMNGFQVICNGGITTTGTGYIAGTTSILLNGTGTWTSDSSNIFVTSNAIRNNTTINTAGTITFVDKVSFNTGTLTYVAGTLVTAGGVLACNTSTTLNTPGVNWHTVLFGGTITLSSVINVTDTAILSGTVTFIGANRFTQTGNLKLINSVVLTMINNITVLEDIVIPAGESTDHDLGTSSAFQIYTGGFDVQGGNTSGSYQTLYFNTIVVNGTSTWQGSVYLQGNLIINTAGTLTVTGLVYAKQGSITYQAGTVVTTDSTLNCDGGIVLNTSGLLWDNVKFGGRSYNSTYTLNSTLNVTGTLYLNNAYTGANSYLGLNGTAGFIASGLIVEQKQSLPPFFEYPDTYSLILQSGVTYEVLNTFTATNNAERLRLVIKSSTPEQKTYLKLAPSAIQRLAYVSATDIDSSAGQKIWSYDTILTRTENWQDLSLIVQDLNVGSTSVENAYTWLA